MSKELFEGICSGRQHDAIVSATLGASLLKLDRPIPIASGTSSVLAVRGPDRTSRDRPAGRQPDGAPT